MVAALAVDSVMQFQTGRPYTVTSGTDNSLDGIATTAQATGHRSNRRRIAEDGGSSGGVRRDDLGTFGTPARALLRTEPADLGHGLFRTST